MQNYTSNKNGVQKTEKIGIDNKFIIKIKAYNIQKKNQKTKQTNTPLPQKKQYKEKKRTKKSRMLQSNSNNNMYMYHVLIFK